MNRYSYDRTAKVNFDSVTHKAAEADGKMTEAYLALHSFKAGLDDMHEIPAYLQPLYKQVMKALDKLTDAKAEAYQLSMMTRRTFQSMR